MWLSMGALWDVWPYRTESAYKADRGYVEPLARNKNMSAKNKTKKHENTYSYDHYYM